jgi:uncharacterized protein YidB (DUF937 family)
MSPITMALLGLLAYKALKSFSGQPGAAAPAPAGTGPAGGRGEVAGTGQGGSLPAEAGLDSLGGLLSGGLGGLLGGSAAGGILSNGLGELLKQFQQSGHGDAAKSWVDSGPNKSISPDDLAKALGADQIDALAAHSGLSREDLLSGLSQQLPEAVDRMTPDGRLPTEHELSRAL